MNGRKPTVATSADITEVKFVDSTIPVAPMPKGGSVVCGIKEMFLDCTFFGEDKNVIALVPTERLMIDAKHFDGESTVLDPKVYVAFFTPGTICRARNWAEDNRVDLVTCW